MKTNIKNIVVTCSFLIFTVGFMLFNIFTVDKSISFSERRKLVQLPSYTNEKLLSGELFSEFQHYSLDQFVLREQFRTIKAMIKSNVFLQTDNNGIYLEDNSVYKIEYPLNEKSVLYAAKKYNELYDRFLSGMNVYYSIIPDKNYYIASKKKYPSIDYDKMTQIMNSNVKNMKYIDLYGSLSLSDYYHTDIHWSQDKILSVADQLLLAMGNTNMATNNEFTTKKLYPFYGSFYGQSALNISPDTLSYLTNEIIENCIVYDYQNKSYTKVYANELFQGVDPYDVFLSGAKPLLEIKNPLQTNNRELYIFRDSFSSSLAPLLISEYSKITLIDLRYIDLDILNRLIEFKENSDVLFLYNTTVLNNSAMLR